jgi:aminoglycoside phosphotransferase (APT) family kinase protein
MIVSKSNVVHYLLEQCLVELDSVVDGDLMVAEATRRNRNFKIIRRNAKGYFVKQIQNWDPQAVAGLAGEATCYRLAYGGPEFAALAHLVPRHFLYDSQRHVLVTELLADGETLSDHYRRLNDFPLQPAKLLGRLLGELHREDLRPLANSPEAAAFRRQIPWILWAYQHGTHLFSTLSAANTQLLQIVQSYPEFQRTLDELRQEWQFDGLMHGDVKWDNCVVYPDPSAEGTLALKVIDWELADIGDLRWDLGALLQAYISFWVLSMRISGALPAAVLAETAQYPIEKMQPSIRAFWRSYVEARALDRQSAQALLASSMKFGAARMIQTAYEYMQYSPQISSNALCLLQVSFNILKEPSDAVTHLLGL